MRPWMPGAASPGVILPPSVAGRVLGLPLAGTVALDQATGLAEGTTPLRARCPGLRPLLGGADPPHPGPWPPLRPVHAGLHRYRPLGLPGGRCGATASGWARTSSPTSTGGWWRRLAAARARADPGALPASSPDGVLNAFATKLLSRRFVILHSALADACSDPRQLDFVLGHEVGHLAAGHLTWNGFLLPFRLRALAGGGLQPGARVHRRSLRPGGGGGARAGDAGPGGARRGRQVRQRGEPRRLRRPAGGERAASGWRRPS